VASLGLTLAQDEKKQSAASTGSAANNFRLFIHLLGWPNNNFYSPYKAHDFFD
jgi:hypothetical protein